MSVFTNDTNVRKMLPLCSFEGICKTRYWELVSRLTSHINKSTKTNGIGVKSSAFNLLLIYSIHPSQHLQAPLEYVSL